LVNYENIIEFNNIFFKAIGFLFLIQYCCSEPIQKNLRLKRQLVTNDLNVNSLIERAVRDRITTVGLATTANVGAQLVLQGAAVTTAINGLTEPVLNTLRDFGVFIFGPLHQQFDVPNLRNKLIQIQTLFTEINRDAANRNTLVQPIINRVQNEQASNFDLQSFLNGNNRQFPQGNRNLPRNPNDIFQDLVDFLNQRLP
jgi:hypothetical protein